MDLDQSGRARLAYLVHDVHDAAVRRRVDMFAQEGFSVDLGGFRRHADVNSPGAAKVVDLGQTMDARLGQRAMLVVRHLFSPGKIRALCAQAPVIVTRNLEMLILGAWVRTPRQRLVYECLDIHRLMLGASRKSRLMRWIERRLLSRTDLVIVSSPAFAQEYFGDRQNRRDGLMLVENKVPVERRQSVDGRGDGVRQTTYKIGWFGMLRCRKTLQQLAALAAQSQGIIEVVIAGSASPAEFPDFAQDIARLQGVHYLGRYRPDQLPALYGQVDFVWAIDYFEEGLNSDWLLPNRLYEGLANGVVPIALTSVETGRWLRRHGVGLLVDDPMAELPGALSGLRPDSYAEMRDAIAALPEDVLYQTATERRQISSALVGGVHV